MTIQVGDLVTAYPSTGGGPRRWTVVEIRTPNDYGVPRIGVRDAYSNYDEVSTVTPITPA